jgi:GT2 family glycosyltransferase
MPFVSVVIPTFNRSTVLSRAIESVIQQYYRDFELLIVNDGSTDDTPQLLSRYEKYLKVVHQKNSGVSAARNAGVRASSGELIAFLDSDDEWLHEKLEKQVQHFRSVGYLISHTDEIWLNKGNPVRQRTKHAKQGGLFFKRALERCLISPSSVIITRTLFDKIGLFDESLPAAEDYDLWLRITARFAIHFIPEPLIIKHAGEQNQLSVVTPAIDRYRIKAIIKALNNSDLSNENRQMALQELGKKCRIMASGCRKRGRFVEADEFTRLFDDQKTQFYKY